MTAKQYKPIHGGQPREWPFDNIIRFRFKAEEATVRNGYITLDVNTKTRAISEVQYITEIHDEIRKSQLTENTKGGYFVSDPTPGTNLKRVGL